MAPLYGKTEEVNHPYGRRVRSSALFFSAGAGTFRARRSSMKYMRNREEDGVWRAA